MLCEAKSDPKYSHVCPCIESFHHVYTTGDIETVTLGTSGREVTVIKSSIRVRRQSYSGIFFFFFLLHWVLGFSYTYLESNRFSQNKTKMEHSLSTKALLSLCPSFGLWLCYRPVCLSSDVPEPFIKKDTINKLVSVNYPLLLDTILCFLLVHFFSSPAWENTSSPQHLSYTSPAL